MKVVASTKLTRAERAMREAKKYGTASNGELAAGGEHENAMAESRPGTRLKETHIHNCWTGL